MSEPATARNHPARLHRNHNYLWWLASDTGTAFGTALQSFAIPLLALYVTGSPAQAGIVAAIGQVGRVVAILPGGVLADRHDRRMLMLAGGALGLAILVAVSDSRAQTLLADGADSVEALAGGLQVAFAVGAAMAALAAAVGGAFLRPKPMQEMDGAAH